MNPLGSCLREGGNGELSSSFFLKNSRGEQSLASTLDTISYWVELEEGRRQSIEHGTSACLVLVIIWVTQTLFKTFLKLSPLSFWENLKS
jgi:hypothetical protein